MTCAGRYSPSVPSPSGLVEYSVVKFSYAKVIKYFKKYCQRIKTVIKLSMKKEEYTRKLKQLIKKYHPDLCNDVNLEKMYNEITIKLNNKLNQFRIENDVKENIVLKNIENESYEYYKLGIKYYKNIHPNQFYKRNVDRTYEPKTYGEQIKILNKIFISFNIAEYYFTKVIIEYPKSEWTDDAREKLKLLKKLYKSYENINIEENNQIKDSNKFVEEMGLKIL